MYISYSLSLSVSFHLALLTPVLTLLAFLLMLTVAFSPSVFPDCAAAQGENGARGKDDDHLPTSTRTTQLLPSCPAEFPGYDK